jgi:hypothetical protein
VASPSVGVGWPTSRGVSLIPLLVPAASWGDAAAGENRAPTSVLAASRRRYLVKDIVVAVCIYSVVLLWGNPRSGYPESNDDDTLVSLYLLRASFL